MSTFYENSDLMRLADRVVKELYRNKDIYNYVHNGKHIPGKYEKIIQRTIHCSNINNYKSLQTILTNAIRYSFNQNTQINTIVATEYRIYRETCERNKIILLSLKKKKSLGDNSVDTDIEKKEEEIKLLQKKIDEIANITNTKPEFNKNILALAEEAYLLLLRIDKTPYYFYFEICKKLGLRINLDQQFPGFRDKDTLTHKSTFIKKEDNEENEDYRNFLDMNIKKGVYVPPSFRKDNINKKVNKLNELNELNEKNTTSKKEFLLDEAFPELGNVGLQTSTVNLTTSDADVDLQTSTVNLTTSNVNVNLTINKWGKKPNIIPDIVKEIKMDNTNEDVIENKIVKETKQIEYTINEEYVFNTSWEVCDE